MSNAKWRSRGRWGIVVLGTAAVFCACSDSSDDDEPNPMTVGGGGSAQGGTNPQAGKSAQAGKSGQEPHAGAGGLAGGGVGGGVGGEGGMSGNRNEMGGAGSPGGAGVGGFDECGGCEQPHTLIKCTSGDVSLSEEEQLAFDGGVALGCAAVQRRFDERNAGGAGGIGGAGGQAGADPGLCSSYVEPGQVVVRYNGDCHETENEFKRGECVLRSECCVVVDTWLCAP